MKRKEDLLIAYIKMNDKHGPSSAQDYFLEVLIDIRDLLTIIARPGITIHKEVK